jgi:predicted ArsR family transcriptional regulator
VDIPIRPGDALAQSTRADLFSLLGELRRPASTEELAERLRLHPNGVRTHLERLMEAGLLARERERQARGRPRDMWVISPEAQPGGDPPTAYAQLGRWLVRALVSGTTGVRAVEAAGRQIGRELAPHTTDAPREQQLYDVLTALGFQPRRAPQPDGRLTYCLRNCPYRDVVRERQPLVCGLHRGMTRGLLDEIEPKTRLSAFVPKDPYSAGCEITLRGPLAKEAGADR